MHIEETKTRVKELLSRITVRDNLEGDPYSHLEAEEWIELDTVKYELARVMDDIQPIGSYSDRDNIEFSFNLGGDLATAILRYHVALETVAVDIRLIGDPSVDETDGFSGDENQAWMLFHALSAEEREDFIESVTDTYQIMPDVIETMIGDEAPEPGPNPALLPRVPAPTAPRM
jgi:hypothetical protein